MRNLSGLSVVKMPEISSIDPTRFAHLSEAEVLQRIGALLAKAALHSGFLTPNPAHARQVQTMLAPDAIKVDERDLIGDAVERKLVEFIRCAGPTSPSDLAAALGIPRRTVARKLRRLRSVGLCAVAGHTKAARYSLRIDHCRN